MDECLEELRLAVKSLKEAIKNSQRQLDMSFSEISRKAGEAESKASTALAPVSLFERLLLSTQVSGHEYLDVIDDITMPVCRSQIVLHDLMMSATELIRQNEIAVMPQLQIIRSVTEFISSEQENYKKPAITKPIMSGMLVSFEILQELFRKNKLKVESTKIAIEITIQEIISILNEALPPLALTEQKIQTNFVSRMHITISELQSQLSEMQILAENMNKDNERRTEELLNLLEKPVTTVTLIIQKLDDVAQET